jgi:diguanylate cyclase (GGDEF)-like protein/PAS domain S-box-containing protein
MSTDSNILIVDDDETNRYTLARRLAREGYNKVTMAGNGVEALAALRQDKVDLVLLDIMMPVMDGFAVLEAMNADAALKQVPVLVISAVDESASFMRAIELGAQDYLSKPFDPVLLRVRVKTCLERRRLQQSVTELLAESRAMLELSPVATFFFKHLKLIWMNPVAEQLLGYASSEMVGTSTEFLHSSTDDYRKFVSRTGNVLKSGAPFRGDVHLRRKDNKTILARLSAKAIAPWDLDRGIIWIAEDVTEQRTEAARVQFLAHHDTLTGLPNRLLLQDRLKIATAQSLRAKNAVGVIFLDLDKFKGINDSLGHAVGDLLLIEVAKRLRAAVRESDTVVRLGGDEFVIVLPGLRAAEDAVVVAQKVQVALAQPYTLQDHTVNTTPSIGVALYPNDTNDPEAILKRADEAMYAAKQAGRNQICYAQPLDTQ